MLDGRFEVAIGPVELLLQPSNVSFDTLGDRLGRAPHKTVLLRAERAEELLPAIQHRLQKLGLLAGKRLRFGTKGLGKASQVFGAPSIGLGPASGGPGEVAYLTGVDYGDRQPRGGEGGGQETLEAPASHKDYEDRTLLPQASHESIYARLVVSNAEALAGRSHGDV